VRQKLIQAAIERVKQRAEATQKVEEGEGPGSGPGAVASGQGGSGGGIVKGVEFLVYRNRMLQLIKEHWTWVGKRTDLEVTVRFGIKENGEIVGLRLVQPSGDLSYDDSVLRAVRTANPLPPPPENYRKDFMDVQLIFRPKDLRG
jgi:colicin import membrane protein